MIQFHTNDIHTKYFQHFGTSHDLVYSAWFIPLVDTITSRLNTTCICRHKPDSDRIIRMGVNDLNLSLVDNYWDTFINVYNRNMSSLGRLWPCHNICYILLFHSLVNSDVCTKSTPTTSLSGLRWLYQEYTNTTPRFKLIKKSLYSDIIKTFFFLNSC